MDRIDVVYRPDTLADLIEIYGSIRDRGSSVVARSFVARIKARCDHIGETPFAGRPRDDLEPGLRTIAFERRVVIAYKVENGLVRIGNVFYGGRDYEVLYGQFGPRDDQDDV